MQFGVFDHLDRNDLPLADYYEARLKIIEAYDRFGFYAYHVAEHHSTPIGLAPSPSVFLSAVAQRTKRLRFGPMVYALPLYHPLRMIEEICMLDQMSHGRLEMGFGRGSVAASSWRITARTRAVAQEIYAEALELVLKGLTEPVLTFHGKHFNFDNVPMELVPLQKPHPPVWYGLHAPESAERAAHKGLQVVSLDPVPATRAAFDAFRDAWREAWGNAPLPLMGLGRFIVVAETDAEALAIARRAYPRWHAKLHPPAPAAQLPGLASAAAASSTASPRWGRVSRGRRAPWRHSCASSSPPPAAIIVSGNSRLAT